MSSPPQSERPPRLLVAPAQVAGLVPLYAVGPGPHVRANFVSTLDGHATGADGRSGSINSAADKAAFTALRVLADAVVVGAGTLRQEGYGRLRTRPDHAELRADAAGVAGVARRAEHPTLVVVTASGQVPDKILSPPSGSPAAGEVVVLCAASTPTGRLAAAVGAGAIVVCGEDSVDPATAVRALNDRGLVHLLTEGGPQLFGQWLAAGVVDELCLTVRPSLIGGPGLRIVEGELLATQTPDARITQVLAIEGDLMLRVALER